jgi:hypothetical protein
MCVMIHDHQHLVRFEGPPPSGTARSIEFRSGDARILEKTFVEPRWMSIRQKEEKGLGMMRPSPNGTNLWRGLHSSLDGIPFSFG